MILSESTKSAQLGQRACPCWATCLPHLGTLLAPLGQKMHQTAAQLVNVVTSTFLFSGFCQHMQFLPSDTSSHLQTIQTIENNHQVANHLYIKALQQKPDNLTILIVFFGHKPLSGNNGDFDVSKITINTDVLHENYCPPRRLKNSIISSHVLNVSEPRAIVVPMNPERSHSATGAMR